jgi:hypothetical protein
MIPSMLTPCRNVEMRDLTKRQETHSGFLGYFVARNSPEENVIMARSQTLVSPYTGLDESSAFYTSVAKQSPPQRSH